MTVCSRCQRPVADNAYVCQICADDLRAALRQVAAVATRLEREMEPDPKKPGEMRAKPIPREQFLGWPNDPWGSARGASGDLASELAVSFSRQSRSGFGSGGGRPAERPVPWDERAAEAQRRLEVVLVGVARMVSEERGVEIR